MKQEEILNLILDKLDNLDQKVDKLEQGQDKLSEKFDKLEQGQAVLGQKVDKLQTETELISIKLNKSEEDFKNHSHEVGEAIRAN